jgi:metal-responsive CopG/Arc/MetJ family transcriptional regulator
MARAKEVAVKAHGRREASARTQQVVIYMTPALVDEASQAAEEDGVSRSEWIVDAIQRKLANRQVNE